MFRCIKKETEGFTMKFIYETPEIIIVNLTMESVIVTSNGPLNGSDEGGFEDQDW